MSRPAAVVQLDDAAARAARMDGRCERRAHTYPGVDVGQLARLGLAPVVERERLFGREHAARVRALA
jgi:hypothetical protein